MSDTRTELSTELSGERPEAGGQDRLPFILAAGVAVLTTVPIVSDKLEALSVVCVLAMPFLIARVAKDKLVRLLCFTLAVWALGQLLSDEIHGLGPNISMQFVSAVTILCIFTVMLFLGKGEYRRVRFLVIGERPD
jgi:hypothetical protein